MAIIHTMIGKFGGNLIGMDAEISVVETRDGMYMVLGENIHVPDSAQPYCLSCSSTQIATTLDPSLHIYNAQNVTAA